MTSSRPSTAEKRKTFRKLHEAGLLRHSQSVECRQRALSAGPRLQGAGDDQFRPRPFARLCRRRASRDQVLAHFAEIAAATDVPLNADFEDGLADTLDGLAENVARCIATGVAGLSIEDSPNDGKTPLYDLDTAVTRVKAARAAIDRAGGDVVFTARAENFVRGVNDLDDAIRRLKAYAAAGADCLYAPGINKREQIEAVVKAVAPKPVNFLNSGAFGFTVADLAAMGVRRISVGGSLARVAMHAFIRTATEIAKDGKFDGFAGLITNAELNKFFARRPEEAFAMTPSEPHPLTGQPIGLPRRESGARAAPWPGDAQGPLRPSRKTRAGTRG